MDELSNEPGPARVKPRVRPRPSDVAAGILTGLGLAGVVGGLALAAILSGIRNANPEPNPGGVAAGLLALLALMGGLSAVGGAYRGAPGGAVGCAALPLLFLVFAVLAPALGRGDGGLGWFFWLPCAVVLLFPLGAIVGLVAQIGIDFHRRSRSPDRSLAMLGVAVLVVYALAWTLVYTAQVARDRALQEPPPAPGAPLPASRRPLMPDEMQPSSEPPRK